MINSSIDQIWEPTVALIRQTLSPVSVLNHRTTEVNTLPLECGTAEYTPLPLLLARRLLHAARRWRYQAAAGAAAAALAAPIGVPSAVPPAAVAVVGERRAVAAASVAVLAAAADAVAAGSIAPEPGRSCHSSLVSLAFRLEVRLLAGHAGLSLAPARAVAAAPPAAASTGPVSSDAVGAPAQA